MCLYTHIMVGALAGAAAPRVLFAPVLGLSSHVILDFFPHYDLERVRDELILGGIAFGLLFAAGFLDAKVLLGALFGALPDLENLFWKSGIITDDEKIFPSHSGVIPHGRELGRNHLLIQVALSGVSLLLLFKI